jgi:hypothetical protein
LRGRFRAFPSNQEDGLEKRDLKLAAAMTALVLTGSLSRAADRTILTVVLHVTDLAGTDRGDLARARTEAQRIFDDTGVRLVWVDIANGPKARACEGLNLYVSFLSPFLVRQRASRGAGQGVLGSASPSTGHAFIYSERVTELAPRRRIDEGVLLGRVIAHEVGHLLLGGHDHSRSGLMTAGMETDPTGLRALFRSKEVLSIRARLESNVPSPEERANCGAETVTRER